MGTKKFEKYEL